MPTATEERIRACLIREGVCEEAAAERVAAVIAEEIERGDSTKVEKVDLNARMAQLEATVARLGREFAEQNAQLATEMRDFVMSMQELERERDERERQRDWKWDERLQRVQRVVYVGLGASTTALGILITVLALVT